MSFDPIDEALDIEPIKREPKKHDLVHVHDDDSLAETTEVAKVSDQEKDYQYARAQIYSLIEKGQEAVNGILELAQESDQPRAYEVAGQLIKSVADATDKLMELQKKLKEVEEEKQSKGPSTVNNALFVGSTAELAKMLKHGLKEDNK